MDSGELVAPLVRPAHTVTALSEDRELIARTLAGEDAAFRLLMERYCPMVLGMLYLGARDLQLAEDLLQETFLKAYTRLGSLRGQEKFSAWVRAIARNELRAHLRHQSAARRGPGREVSAEHLQEAQEAAGSGAPTPREAAARNELGRLVLEEVANMNEVDALVLHMRLFSEMGPQEIARTLDMTEGAARVRLLRALGKLRERLALRGLTAEELR